MIRPSDRRARGVAAALVLSWCSLTWFPAAAQVLPASLTLTNISIQGQPRTLSLYKRTVRSSSFHYLTWSAATGYQTNTPPQVRTYRGTVVGSPNTIVCAVIRPGGLLNADGFDYEQGKSYTWQISEVNVSVQLPAGSFAPPAAQASLWSGWIDSAETNELGELSCGHPDCQSGSAFVLDAPAEPDGPAPSLELILPPSTYMPPSGGMQVMDLGIDITHYRYVNTYGGSADAAFANIEHTVNIYDLLMARDAMIGIQQSVMVLRQDIFYVPTGMGDQLNKMLTEWKQAPLFNLPWDQVYSFQTEQGLFGAGGYAWGNSIGKDESPACVEALYHEAGHNWDVVHLVYGRDTMGGNRPNHGPFSIDRLLRKRNESITEGDLSPYPGTYPDPLPPYTHVDCATTLTNTPVNINVLANDWDGNGNPLTVIAFSTNTARGGTVSWVNNGTLRYTPAAGYVGKDLFAYTVRDSTGLKTRDLVHVEVINRDLAVHYTFDDPSGKLAGDATGHGHAGKLQGATDFSSHAEPGISGQALRVEGGGIICDNSPLMPADAPLTNNENYYPFDTETMSRGNFFDPMDESATIAFWFKTYDTSVTRSLLRKQWHDEQKVGFNLTISGSGVTATVREFNGLSNVKTLNWSTALADARWYHVTLQFDRTASQARLFVDGVQRATAAVDAGRFIFQGRQPLLLGMDAGGKVVFDEFRYYTKALSTSEIQALYTIGHIAASGPNPADGERDVALQPTLSWVAGRAGYEHDLFFGTNRAAVTAATTSSAEYKGRRLVANYPVTAALAPDTDYFWRVDEILGGTNVAGGDVWGFRTATDVLHGGLRVHLSLDNRDTVGAITYDRAGPPFQDGALVNGPTSVAGQVGEAFQLNGVNQHITIPALNQTTDKLTLMTWVRRNGSVNDWSGIVFHRLSGAVSGLNIATANRLGYHWNDAASTYNFNSGLTLPDGQWALTALVVEPTRAILYLGTANGVLAAATNNVAHGLSALTGEWRAGSDSASSTRYLNAAMDQIAIWNRPLSRAEIGLILTNGMSGGGIDGPPPVPQPGTFTWTGSADNLWGTPANWAANAVPGTGNTAIFDESSANNLNTDLGQNISVSGLLLTGKLRGAGVASAAGNTLSLNSGGIKLSNSFTSLSLNAPVTLGANQAWSVSEFAALTVNSNVAGSGRTLTLDCEGPAFINSLFSGSGGLVKRGSGTASITAGLQPFTGGLTISNGTLKAFGGHWSRSFFANVSPRTITVHSGGTLETTTHSLGGLGASFYQPVVTLNDGARWSMAAEQYLSGGNLALKGATISIAANDLRLQGGTVNIANSPLLCSISGAGSITLHGTTTFNVADGPLATDMLISVPIGSSGVQGLTKAGTGTLALAEPVSHTGLTVVSGGTLSLLGGKDTLPQAMSLAISNGATLRLNNHDQTLAGLSGGGSLQLGYGCLTLAFSANHTYGGVISGSPDGAPPPQGYSEETFNPGGLVKAGTGRFTLTANQTYTGDTIISAGTLALSGGGALSGSSNIVVAAAAILDVAARTGGTIPLSAGQRLTGDGTVLGGVSLGTGSVLVPGLGIGRLTTGSQTWAGGAACEFELSDATAAGSSDLITIGGTLTLSATAGNRCTLRVSVPGGGPLPGFNNQSNYTWIVATTTGGLAGFSPEKISVDITRLGVDAGNGSFSAQQHGNNLVLQFVPATAPTTPSGIAVVTPQPGGTMTLTVTGAVGQVVVLQANTNLAAANWLRIGTNSIDNTGSVLMQDSQAMNYLQRFYRTASE